MRKRKPRDIVPAEPERHHPPPSRSKRIVVRPSGDRRRDHLRRWLFRGVDVLRRHQTDRDDEPKTDPSQLDEMI